MYENSTVKIKNMFQSIKKILHMKNIIHTFAPSLQLTGLLKFVSVAVFFAAYQAFNAVNIGYQISLDCCTSSSVIVSCKTGGDSLSYINNFNFSS